MKTEYILSNDDLYFIFGTRLSQVKDGLLWYYQSNNKIEGNMSPKEAVEILEIPIKTLEEIFREQFGNIDPEIVDYKLSSAKKKAILERYPNTKLVPFKEKYGHHPIWFFFDKLRKRFTKSSVTSFGDNVIRPCWLSALSDFLCVITFGIIKPKRRPGERCLGDMSISIDS